jgi:hypothetical protein
MATVASPRRNRRFVTALLIVAALASLLVTIAYLRGWRPGVDLTESDWFALLWPVVLIPVSWLFERQVERSVARRAVHGPQIAPPQIIFDHARATARAEAQASAHARADAHAEARAHAAGPSRTDDDTWSEFVMVAMVGVVVVIVLSTLGVFFAGVRFFASSSVLAVFAVVFGYALGCAQTLHRDGALDASWTALLSLSTGVAFTGATGAVLGLDANLADGRYEQMLRHFDRLGSAGLKGFGQITSSVYLGLQALSVVGLLALGGWMLVSLGGMMAMRYEQSLGLSPRARLGLRVAPLGPSGTLLLLWLFVGLPAALCLSGLPYNWTFKAAREAVDRRVPLVTAAEVAGRQRPVLRFRVNEVGTAVVTVRRERRDGRVVEIERVRFAVEPGRVEKRIARLLDRRLRSGGHRITLVVRDDADNRSRAIRLRFDVRRQNSSSRRR